jgi:glucosylglycerate synthase
VYQEGVTLADETFLSDDFVRQLTAVGEVDIVVGVPTFNNRQTIGRVLNALQVGLVKYFPRQRSVLINPDGGSTDGTLEQVRTTSIQDFQTLLASSPLRTMHRITTSYSKEHDGKTALRAILTAADLLRAKACALVSPDLESITPEWIEVLVRPVYKEKFDFVAPIYHRHKFDGLLVKNLLSPITRAVYGYNIREPVGSEFAFSGQLACHYIAQDVWSKDFAEAGLGVWMTTTAIVGGFRLCQSFLGPRIHTAKPAEDLVQTIQGVVGDLFRCLEAHESFWLSHNSSQPTPVFGFEYSVALEPIRINRQRMLQMFRVGATELSSILQSILSPGTLEEIQQIARLSDREFRFRDELWAKTVYEFASSYHRSVITRDHLLQALVPLYRGRIGSFVLENYRADAEQIEKKLEGLGLQYQNLKPRLIESWTAKK